MSVTEDEPDAVGLLGPMCAKICFDDDIVKKQVTYIVWI